MSAATLLSILDRERRRGGPPDADGLIREWSPDRSECRIVFAAVPPARLAETVRDERGRAQAGGYALEWKVYGYDPLPQLPEILTASGFEADDAETVLGLELDEAALRRFDGTAYETRTVRDESGLADAAEIAREIGRGNVESERRRLGAELREHPDELSIHIVYLEGKPVASGRIHYGARDGVAELAGGRTVTTHRRRGLFTAVVGARLREAARRGYRYIFVDALPTSEPTLRKLGFAALTTTQPFVYEP